MTKKEIDKLVDEELTKLITADSTKFIMFMLIKMGEMCIDTNADSLVLKQESTLNHVRYQIRCRITVKEIEPTTPTVNKIN
jgi:hypothetical protein